jgi:hypothetical protein
LPDVNPAELIEEKPDAKVSIAELAAMGADVGALTREYRTAVVGDAPGGDDILDMEGEMRQGRMQTLLPAYTATNAMANEEAEIARMIAMQGQPGMAQGEEEMDDMPPPLERIDEAGLPEGTLAGPSALRGTVMDIGQIRPIMNEGSRAGAFGALVEPQSQAEAEPLGELGGPPAIQMAPPLPAGPQTLVVDTSPEAMAAENLPAMGTGRRTFGGGRMQGELMEGGAMGMGIQSRTLRMGGGMRRQMQQPMQQQQQQAPHPMAHVAVTVNKLG